MTVRSGQLAGGVQIDRLQKAADDARHQLESKENIVKELSRDGSKLDKERYDVVSDVRLSTCEFLRKHEVACKPMHYVAVSDESAVRCLMR